MNIFLALAAVAFSALPAYAAPTACTLEYAPVCGSLEVQCIKAPCYPILQTYSNRCFLNAEGATFMHEGECTETEYSGGSTQAYEPPPTCTAWFDGCNNCSKGADGMAMCTLRACVDEPTPGYCISYETDTTPRDTGEDGGTVSSPPAEDIPLPPHEENPEPRPMNLFSRVWYIVSNWIAALFP